MKILFKMSYKVTGRHLGWPN